MSPWGHYLQRQYNNQLSVAIIERNQAIIDNKPQLNPLTIRRDFSRFIGFGSERGVLQQTKWVGMGVWFRTRTGDVSFHFVFMNIQDWLQKAMKSVTQGGRNVHTCFWHVFCVASFIFLLFSTSGFVLRSLFCWVFFSKQGLCLFRCRWFSGNWELCLPSNLKLKWIFAEGRVSTFSKETIKMSIAVDSTGTAQCLRPINCGTDQPQTCEKGLLMSMSGKLTDVTFDFWQGNKKNSKIPRTSWTC